MKSFCCLNTFSKEAYKTLFFCLMCFSVFSQNISFESIKNQTKLINTTITHITQDDLGFLWISSYDGLHRYDGNELYSYQYDTSSSKSLPSNIVLQTAIDKKQNLWGVTPTKGIFKINLKTNQISLFPKLNLKIIQEGKNANNLLIIENKIWLGCDNGLIELDILSDTLKFKKLHKPLKVNFPTITNLKKAQKGILVSINNLTLLFDKNKNWQELTDNSLLFPNNHKFKKFNLKITLPDNRFKNCFVDSKDNIWLNYKKYLSLINDDGQIIKCEIQNNSGINIRTIYEDDSKTIWLGTTHGLYKYIPHKNNFKTYRFSTLNSKKNIAITALEQGKKNKLWIGTDGAGIHIVDSIDTLQPKTIIKNAEPISITTLNSDSYKKIWGGYSESQNLIHFKDSLSNPIFNTQYPIVENYKRIMDIDFDKDEIWISTISGGLFKITNINTSKKIQQFISSNTNSFPSNVVRSIAIDKKKNIWIGTDKGLVLITTKEREKETPDFKIFKHQLKDTTSISADYILPITESNNGSIWIGTFGGGINHCTYDSIQKRYKFKNYTTKEGLTNNTIKSIVEDNSGIIWMGTNYGISSLNPKTGYIQNFYKKDGLSDNIFMDLSSVKLTNGNIAFGGQTGITLFDPTKIVRPEIFHQPIFTKLEINNKEVFPNFKDSTTSILNEKIEYTKKISLKNDENNFSLNISSLNLIGNSNVFIYYKLEPLDGNWIKLDPKSSIVKFNSVPPGKYLLKTRNSINPDKVTTLEIQIKASFWERNYGWFILLFLIGISFFTFTFLNNGKSLFNKKSTESELPKNTSNTITKNNEFLDKIKTIVIRELSNPDFGVSSLTQEIGLSEYLCNKEIKSLTSLTTNAYIRKLKLEQASLLLKSSNLTIAEITYKVGFRDLQYFRKCFKTEFKITPNEYQKKHKS